MRRTARLPLPLLLITLVLLLITLVLAGCTQPDPMPTPPPTPSAAPVFASDEEALAAAEEAYGKYLETVALVMADGGREPERLRPFLTESLFESEISGYEQLAANGWHGAGSYSFEMSPQDVDLTTGDVNVYVCDDRSQIDILDANGESVVAPDRPDRAASEVEFVWTGSLVISSQTAWDGGGVC